MKFNSLIIDEAGQCIEPLAWCIIPLAEKTVLAGDHWQLPPTVISDRAARMGLNTSILEAAIHHVPDIHLLNIQYRMRKMIAGFSSKYFYNNLLYTAEHLVDTGVHISFIDTAGTGFEETKGPDGSSLQNEGELKIAMALVKEQGLKKPETAFLSPYSGQVTAAKEKMTDGIRISTIDSFQGQEMENIVISLVRSNGNAEIGFLKDYRRMNVAITRAKEQLYVIGDSSTIGNDKFYKEFLEYLEKHGAYRTAWEFDVLGF